MTIFPPSCSLIFWFNVLLEIPAHQWKGLDVVYTYTCSYRRTNQLQVVTLAYKCLFLQTCRRLVVFCIKWVKGIIAGICWLRQSDFHAITSCLWYLNDTCLARSIACFWQKRKRLTGLMKLSIFFHISLDEFSVQICQHLSLHQKYRTVTQ